MTQDELIRRIEGFGTPHSPRVLKQFSQQCLTQYLEYLACRRLAKRCPATVGVDTKARLGTGRPQTRVFVKTS